MKFFSKLFCLGSGDEDKRDARDLYNNVLIELEKIRLSIEHYEYSHRYIDGFLTINSKGVRDDFKDVLKTLHETRIKDLKCFEMLLLEQQRILEGWFESSWYNSQFICDLLIRHQQTLNDIYQFHLSYPQDPCPEQISNIDLLHLQEVFNQR